MRLETALYTSREGMNTHGAAIAAIGDNLSNLNTPGFKSARVEFANLVSSGLGGSSLPTEGGGSGVKVSKVRSIQIPGAIEPTGRPLDMSIDGDGFFVVGTSDAPRFTRAGNFSLDSEGNLITPTGEQVLGFPNVSGTPSTSLGALNLLNFSSNATPTTALGISGNVNSSSAIITAPSNPTSFKDLNAASSFVTSADIVDSLGESHAIVIAMAKTGSNSWTAQAYIDGADVGGTEGTPTLLGTSTLTFNTSGTIDDANLAAAQMVIAPAFSNGAAAGSVTADLSTFTQFANTSTLKSVTQDGIQPGALAGYQVEKDGNLVAVLDNGDRVSIGILATASFSNADGLEKLGNNLYAASDSSGDPVIGNPGTEARGTIEGSSLERSTVDMPNEFTNLILFQRGYQASSKMLGTIGGMLDQAISLLR